jgi:hypothetical protein
MGQFWCFWGSKFKLNFLNMFGQFFILKNKYFLGISKKFLAQRDKRFSNYGRFKGPKWGNFGVFGGQIETKLSKQFQSRANLTAHSTHNIDHHIFLPSSSIIIPYPYLTYF